MLNVVGTWAFTPEMYGFLVVNTRFHAIIANMTSIEISNNLNVRVELDLSPLSNCSQLTVLTMKSIKFPDDINKLKLPSSLQHLILKQCYLNEAFMAMVGNMTSIITVEDLGNIYENKPSREMILAMQPFYHKVKVFHIQSNADVLKAVYFHNRETALQEIVIEHVTSSATRIIAKLLSRSPLLMRCIMRSYSLIHETENEKIEPSESVKCNKALNISIDIDVRLPVLTSVTLDHCILTSTVLKLFEWSHALQHLTLVNLTSNLCTADPEDSSLLNIVTERLYSLAYKYINQDMLSQLSRCTFSSLRHLCLSTTVGISATESVMMMIYNCRRLESIHLERCCFNLKIICNALNLYCPHLTKVTLIQNAFELYCPSCEAMQERVELQEEDIDGRGSRVRELNVELAALEYFEDDLHTIDLVTILCHLGTNIEVLTLSIDGVLAGSFEKFKAMVPRLKALTMYCIDRAAFEEEHREMIISQFRHLPSVRVYHNTNLVEGFVPSLNVLLLAMSCGEVIR